MKSDTTTHIPKENDKTLCSLCGQKTILRPIGINFLDENIKHIFELDDGVKLPKIPTYREALYKALQVSKVCNKCHFGEEVQREDFHLWIGETSKF